MWNKGRAGLEAKKGNGTWSLDGSEKGNRSGKHCTILVFSVQNGGLGFTSSALGRFLHGQLPESYHGRHLPKDMMVWRFDFSFGCIRGL